ncbi:MAG: hypothetical protein ABIS03_02885 [Gemmatimonadaceae bacterium]
MNRPIPLAYSDRARRLSTFRLTATGSHVVPLPMKINGGSGGPLRIVGFVPKA